jgi:hypothetical protein
MFQSPEAEKRLQKMVENQTREENQRYCPIWVDTTRQCNAKIVDDNLVSCKNHVKHWSNPAFPQTLKPYLDLQMLPIEAITAAGVTPTTFKRWVKDFTGFGPFDAFMDAIEIYSMRIESRLLGVIEQHSERDWKAAAYLLKTKRPDRYGERVNSRVELSTDAPKLDADSAAYIIQQMLERPVDEITEHASSPAPTPAGETFDDEQWDDCVDVEGYEES